VEDAAHIDFFNVKTDEAPGAPVFVLNNVKDFSAVRCNPAADTRIPETSHKEI
jgi:hypothetical protein